MLEYLTTGGAEDNFVDDYTASIVANNLSSTKILLIALTLA